MHGPRCRHGAGDHDDTAHDRGWPSGERGTIKGAVNASGRRAWSRGVRASAASLALVAVACGGPPAPPAQAPSRELGPLHTWVPPASTLVVLASPQPLLEAESSRRVLAALFPEDQLDRFSQRTGVDPRRLTQLVLADHPEGRVLIARGPFDPAFAVEEAGERMAPLEASVDRPWVRRAGFLGRRRVDLAAVGDALVWVEGTPQLAAEVLALARRPANRRRHALAGDTVRELHEAYGEAPLAMLAPHPLGLPLETGVGMLLAREQALVVSVRPDGSTIRVELELRGEFPPGAEENFRALARSLAETELGAILGLREALPSLRIEADEARVVLRAELDPVLLSVGLRALLVAELPELVGGS